MKVEKEKEGGKKVVIGLPITKHCKNICLSEGESGSARLESLVIVGLGKEAAPFSSSQMSKIGNLRVS